MRGLEEPAHALGGLEEPEKKVLVVCLAGAQSLLRLKKKILVICLAGALEKKSSSHLSGGCVIVITTGKKKFPVVCLAGARSLLRPEKKKVLVVIVIFVLVQLELNLIQIR